MKSDRSYPTGERPLSAPLGVLPRFVCRLGGLPQDAMLFPETSALWSAVHARQSAQAKALQDLAALSDVLHSLVGGEADRSRRNTLLAARRKLHREKALTERELNLVLEVLPLNLAGLFRSLTAHQAGASRMQDAIEEAYSSTLATERRRFRRLLEDRDFQASLALSSASLYVNLQRYLLPNDDISNSRREQIERGLYRYLSRMATKATPFSRFCSIVPGRIVSSSETFCGRAIEVRGQVTAKRAAIRANKQIFSQIWLKLRTIPEYRANMQLMVNPTMSSRAEDVTFLAAENGKEIFRRIPASTELSTVLALVTREPTFTQLVGAIAADSRFEASESDAEAYVAQLLSIGLLQAVAIVAEQEYEWIAALRAFVMHVDSPSARQLQQSLTTLQATVAAFGALDAPSRSVALDEVRGALADAYECLQIPPRAVTDLPLYEDAAGLGEVTITATPAMLSALERTAEWVKLVSPLAAARPEQAMMRHFFDTYYAPERSALGIPLMDFYEDYYREHFKEHLAKVAQSKAGAKLDDYDIANPFSLAIITEIQRASTALQEAICQRWDSEGDVHTVTLRRADVEKALARVAVADRKHRSYNLFLQLVEHDDGRITAVLPTGNIAPGYGKFFSRFLHILPEDVQAAVVARNMLDRNELLAELCSDGAFNANLHPKLLPFDIHYPTSDGRIDGASITVDDICVMRDDHDAHSLRLHRASDGVPISPVDLGFLSPQRRPPLYQMLTHFCPVRFFSLQIPYQPLPSVASAPPASRAEIRVRRRPRIVFEDALVLSRLSLSSDFRNSPQTTCEIPHPGFTPRVQDARRGGAARRVASL